MAAQQMPIPTQLLEEVGELLNRLNEQLQQGPDDLDHFQYRLETIIHILSRLASTGSLQHEEEIFSQLHTALEKLENLHVPVPVQRGTSFEVITQHQLEYLLDQNFRVGEVAKIYSVSVRTIRRRMTEYGLSVRQMYSVISDQQLQEKVSEAIANCPNIGSKIVSGYLMSIGHRVQQRRIREALRAVDPVGTVLRGLQLHTTPRRPYSVPAPLSLWHLDGYHKLIHWRIVIHGGIDGFSRKIMFLRAGNNNRASTVLECFIGAVDAHGLPACVRTDKGGENVEVARYMLDHPQRGPDRRCVITGKSVHNQRIERLWRDLWCVVVGNYYAAFRHLEEIGALDRDQDIHLFCLHFVMLPRLNWHLHLFCQMWDRHPLSSEGNKSPQQLWVAGQLLNMEHIPNEMDFPTWGIDWNGPPPSPDTQERVAVPALPPALQETYESLLRSHIDPFRTSEVYGVDLYLQALSMVQAYMAEHSDQSGPSV